MPDQRTRADDNGDIAQAPLALNQVIVTTFAVACAMFEDAQERITQTDNKSTIRAYAGLIRHLGESHDER